MYVFPQEDCSIEERHCNWSYASGNQFLVLGALTFSSRWENSNSVIFKLNRLFKETCTWCTLNKLTLHSAKSEVMSIQRKQFRGSLLCDGRFFHLETNLRLNGNSVLDSRWGKLNSNGNSLAVKSSGHFPVGPV